MDDEDQARAGHMARVRDEARHGIQSSVDLAARSVAMLRQQLEPTQSTCQSFNASITVAIDFGTTYSAVAFSKNGDNSRPIITVIKNYPYDPMRNGIKACQVPTESWYTDDCSTTTPPTTTSSGISSNYGESESESEVNYDQYMEEIMDNQGPEFDNDQSMAEDRMDLIDSAENDLQALCWGFGVRSKLKGDMPRSHYNHVANSKLLLDKMEDTATARRLEQQAKKANSILRSQETIRMRSGLLPENSLKTRSGLLIPSAKIPYSSPPIQIGDEDTANDDDELCTLLQKLKRSEHIESEVDVITHFLTQLMRHVKRQLTVVHEISCSAPIRYVFSVPVTWKPIALLEMQNAMKIAIKTAGLGTMDDLFLVTEPEAAMNYSIQKTEDIKPGDKFLLLDCGGGTIDATAYQAEQEYPLRLSKELVDPGGCTHGSSLLNRDFRKHLKRRIKHQRRNFEINGYTLDGILDEKVLEFEDLKRNLDIYDLKAQPEIFKISGIKPDPKRRLGHNSVEMNQKDLMAIFMPHLREIGKLLRTQLTSAREKGHEVTKVPFTGGFSESPSLKTYLKRLLQKISREFGYNIQLICELAETEYETAVVRGALIQANDKSEGPDRIPQLSYGVEIMEEYNAEKFCAHKGTRPTLDKIDGRYYVNNVISWLIIKGIEVESEERFSIPVYRIFDARETKFECTETLYVSDTAQQSHYRRTHENNRGARVAGKATADMTYLVTEGLIHPIEPEGINTRRHYKIEFDLIMIVNGLNLRFEACWQRNGRSKGVHTDISIAAAFTPGTK